MLFAGTTRVMRQNVRLEPLLEAISTFFDTQHGMIER